MHTISNLAVIIKSIGVIFLLVLSYLGIGQSYLVEIEEIPYDTLTEYTSLGNEKGANMEIPYFFYQEFELGFEFPYFDTIITSIGLDDSGIADIEGSAEYSMYLFSMIQYQLYPEFNVLGHLDSDFRYKNASIDDMEVFIFEFKRVMFRHQFGEEKFGKSDISFQYWFWQNGDIEIRFGDIRIDSSLFEGPIFTEFGTAMAISNLSLTETISVSGDLNNNPDISFYDDWYDWDLKNEITVIPKKNTVCRFKKKTSATVENFTLKELKMPAIVSENLMLPEEIWHTLVMITDLNGRQLFKGTAQSVDISSYPTGMYSLHVQTYKPLVFIKN